ncbi:MAG: protein kinase domain-containing protein, partial [Deltaproteobacteria bacterium]
MNDDASADRREALERPEIRRLIERFEEALLAGENPRIEDAVPADLPERMLILEELLHVEIEFRGKRQEPVALSKYLDRFPQVAADAHAVGRLRETVRRFVPEAQCDDERAVLDVTKSQPAPASEQVPFGRIALQSEFIDSDQPVGGHGRRGADSMATGAAAGTTGSPGRFRILRPHAKGGLGQVSVALDRDLNREVALKEIQPQHADDQTSRERFLVEAEITGGLEHPGIVPVYALGHDPDGRPFYVMRFVKGDSLKQAIEQFHQADNPNRSDPGARQLALRQLLGRF